MTLAQRFENRLPHVADQIRSGTRLRKQLLHSQLPVLAGVRRKHGNGNCGLKKFAQYSKVIFVQPIGEAGIAHTRLRLKQADRI